MYHHLHHTPTQRKKVTTYTHTLLWDSAPYLDLQKRSGSVQQRELGGVAVTKYCWRGGGRGGGFLCVVIWKLNKTTSLAFRDLEQLSFGLRGDGVSSDHTHARVRELLQHVLPALLLLHPVQTWGDQGDEATPPHTRAAWKNVGGKGQTGVVNELPRGVEALATVTEKAGGVGLCIEV